MIDSADDRVSPPEDAPIDLWYEVETDVFLNVWCRDYEDAKNVLAREGGYLLPFRRQFVVVGRGYIEALGLDPDDPAWATLGHDVAIPSDAAAFEQLVSARIEARSRRARRL